MAEVKRGRICAQYQKELERMRVEQPKGGRPTKQKPVEPVPPVSKDDRRTRTRRARAAGTNRQYIDTAENARRAGIAP